MAGNIDYADFKTARECKPGKTEFNGHLAGFFFRQPVGIDAGEGMHQCGLTMIDMTGGTDNEQGIDSRF